MVVPLFLFQNCSNELPSANDASSKSSGTSEPNEVPIGSSEYGSIIIPSSTNPNDPSDVVVGPNNLINIQPNTFIESPVNCTNICQEQQQCASQKSSSERLSCRNSCNRRTGLCAPFELHRDPYTLTSFVVPGGYKKVNITLEHCTDRNDVLVIEGPYLHFKTLNSGAIWNARFGANVGRGPRCKKEDLLDHAKVKVRNFNKAGNFQSEKVYIWKFPAALSYPLNVINDIDIQKPVFVHVKSLKGPGVKIHRIYDNEAYNKQLSFILEYIFWYDPKYTTNFDLYYKPKESN